MDAPASMQSGNVDRWFSAWVDRHLSRCPHKMWPVAPGGSMDEHAAHFFAPWLRAFKQRGLTEAVADEMSLLYAQSGNQAWPGTQQLNALLAHAPQAWDRVRAQSQGLELGTREGCAALSRGCPECNGEGWTAREATQREQVVRFALFCLCPLGEWLAQFYFQQQDKEIYTRVRRLIQYPELWNTGFAHRSWPAAPVARPWPLETYWCTPWIFTLPGAAEFDRGRVGAAVKTVQEGIRGAQETPF